MKEEDLKKAIELKNKLDRKENFCSSKITRLWI